MKAQKLLESLSSINEVSMEDLHDAVAHELGHLEEFFHSVDNKDGKKALEILWHAMVLDPELVHKHVMKAAEIYKKLAPQVKED